MPMLVSVAVQKWNWCGVAGFSSVATTRPIGCGSGRLIMCRCAAVGMPGGTASPGAPGLSGILPRDVKDTTAGPSGWPASPAAHARRRARRSGTAPARWFRGARVPRHRRSAGQTSIQQQPFVVTELLHGRFGQFALEVRARPSHGRLDCLEVARRLLDEIAVDRLDIHARLLQLAPWRRAHAVERRDGKGQAALHRRVQGSGRTAAPHRCRDIRADDLDDAVMRDDAPALDAIQERDRVRDSGFGKRMGVQLETFDDVRLLTRLRLVGLPAIARHGAGGNERLPPGHAVSRTLSPTTRPSRTGMIVATSRGSCAASWLNARTPRAFPD